VTRHFIKRDQCESPVRQLNCPRWTCLERLHATFMPTYERFIETDPAGSRASWHYRAQSFCRICLGPCASPHHSCTELRHLWPGKASTRPAPARTGSSVEKPQDAKESPTPDIEWGPPVAKSIGIAGCLFAVPCADTRIRYDEDSFDRSPRSESDRGRCLFGLVEMQ